MGMQYDHFNLLSLRNLTEKTKQNRTNETKLSRQLWCCCRMEYNCFPYNPPVISMSFLDLGISFGSYITQSNTIRLRSPLPQCNAKVKAFMTASLEMNAAPSCQHQSRASSRWLQKGAAAGQSRGRECCWVGFGGADLRKGGKYCCATAAGREDCESVREAALQPPR